MKKRTQSGFTLIELLVVIAALGILFALMMPALGRGIEFGKRTQAAANMRTIAMAWTQYAHDHEGRLVSADNGWNNNQPPWVKAPSGTTQEAREQSVREGALFPYIGLTDVYADPNHVFPTYVSSYSINGFLNGHWAQPSHQTPEGNGVTHYSRANGSTLLLIPEYDDRGYNINSFIMDPIACNWIDRIAGNYRNGDNLAFVDGHVEYHRWEDPDTLRDLGTHYLKDPGSVDCEYLETVFFPR